MFLSHPVPKTVEDLRQEVSDDNLLALLERKQLAQVKCWAGVPEGRWFCYLGSTHAACLLYRNEHSVLMDLKSEIIAGIHS